MGKVKSDKLPRIRVDPDTGEKYVLLGKKKVWLDKSVTKKTLLKFLRKLKKKAGTKKKVKTQRRRRVVEKEIVPRTFIEPTSRTIIGDTALRLASQALVNSSRPPQKSEIKDDKALLEILENTKRKTENLVNVLRFPVIRVIRRT
jgi:hypothetical protein